MKKSRTTMNGPVRISGRRIRCLMPTTVPAVVRRLNYPSGKPLQLAPARHRDDERERLGRLAARVELVVEDRDVDGDPLWIAPVLVLAELDVERCLHRVHAGV